MYSQWLCWITSNIVIILVALISLKTNSESLPSNLNRNEMAFVYDDLKQFYTDLPTQERREIF